MPKYFLPTEIVDEGNNGWVTLKVPHHSDGTCCTVTVNKCVLIPEDKISENALREYKDAIKSVRAMENKTKKSVFDIGWIADTFELVDKFSPADFIRRVKTYKDRPKTGDVYVDVDNDGRKRTVLWTSMEKGRVYYIVEFEDGCRRFSDAYISSFLAVNKKIDSETITDFNEFFKGMNK